MKRLTLFLLPLIAFLLPPRLRAQQSDHAVEVFALGGGYYHGNFSAAREWRPQVGGGILVPLGRSWGALADLTTGVAETYWKSDYSPGASPNDNFTRERRIALLPSIARLWRTDRVSLYGGVGVGFEHKRQRSHFRPIIAYDENGLPILSGEFQDVSKNSTDAMLVLRIGTIVSVSRKVVFRVDFSYLPRYTDEKASKSLAAGIGYRF